MRDTHRERQRERTRDTVVPGVMLFVLFLKGVLVNPSAWVWIQNFLPQDSRDGSRSVYSNLDSFMVLSQD